jgi:acyl-homoserine-lactone acylase
VNLADAADAMREAGLLDSPLGSNAWAFGKDTTANGSGLLLGNPHFPWAGVNRFWQVHLTIPGNLDVMGVGIGSFPGVTIGFNKDVAWSHTVSTGKRFTLHELTLVPGNPTSYLIDGKPEKMTSRTVSVPVRAADGSQQTKSATLWSTRWGPVVVLPRAGLNWTAKTAYALKDANLGNVRATDAALGFARARNVQEVREAMKNIGTPWVNTLAADRHGNTLYADVSVVPDVDAAQLQRCAPSKPAAALLPAAGLVVLDGSKSACDWQRDPSLAGAGADSHRPHAHRHPDRLGAQQQRRLLLHPSGAEVERHLAAGRRRQRHPAPHPRRPAGDPGHAGRGKVTPAAVQAQLFADRNFMGHVTVPDLLAACAANPHPAPSARRLRRAARLGPHQQPGRPRRPPVPRVLAHGAADPRRVPRALSTRRNPWPPRPG